MDRGTIADSRDDDGSKPIRLSLCDDDDEDASIGSMASISSWLSVSAIYIHYVLVKERTQDV